MNRNLDRRVEVLVPVEQARLRQELTAVFDSATSDTACVLGALLGRNVDAAQARQGRARPRPSAEPAAAGAPTHAPRTRVTQPRRGKRGSDRGACQNHRDARWGHRRGLEHGSTAGHLRHQVHRAHSPRGARAPSGCGEEILRHGRVRRTKLDEVAAVTAKYARIARKLGVRELETVVTAPGRQGDETSACSTRSAAPPRPTSASSRPRRRAGSPSQGPSHVKCRQTSSPSATSAAARRRSSSGRSCSGRRGCGRSTSARCD